MKKMPLKNKCMNINMFWAYGQLQMGTFYLLFVYGTLPLSDFLVVSRTVTWITLWSFHQHNGE